MSAGLLLVGASGLAREVLATGITGVTGILDDDAALAGTDIGGVPVIGPVAEASVRDEQLLVCIGPSASRAAVVDRLRAAGVDESRFATFVARSARVGASSAIGVGSILLDGVAVTADVTIGRHVVVMPNCTITHDDVLDDVATLAAGVALGGGVRIGRAAYLGMNATVHPGVVIGADAVVGMGAVVLRDVPRGQTWVGVPAAATSKDRPVDASRCESELAAEQARMTVPFLDLAAQQAEIVDETLPVWRAQLATSAFVGGPEIDAFEREYAEYIGVEYVVGVSNGTDALELAYRAAGVGPGDEIIMPANTFIATAEAASRIGAVPVFVDVDDEYLLIDPDAIAAAITPRTRVIVPVHLFGQTAPLELIAPIAERHGIFIVEDAAQSQGASGTAGRAGALGRVAATSFYPGKNLGAAGDAGAVLTGDPDIAAAVRGLAAHGSAVKYVHDRIGFNARLDAVQASVLRAKLRRLETWNSARRAAAQRYAELLGGIAGVRLPVVRPGNTDVWHLYVVRVAERDRILAELGKAGIGVGVHYPTIVPRTQAYAALGYAPGQFPVSEAAADGILSLPMFPHLTEHQQATVAAALQTSVGG